MGVISLVAHGGCRLHAVSRVSRLPMLMTLGFAVHRFAVTQRPPATRWRRRRAASGRLGSVGQEGVPVVLPVRDGSPGGSCGTATGGTCFVRRCSRLRFLLRDASVSGSAAIADVLPGFEYSVVRAQVARPVTAHGVLGMCRTSSVEVKQRPGGASVGWVHADASCSGGLTRQVSAALQQSLWPLTGAWS